MLEFFALEKIKYKKINLKIYTFFYKISKTKNKKMNKIQIKQINFLHLINKIN